MSTAYGPRENESHALVGLIARAFAKQPPFAIWRVGEQTRNFTYIDDIVSGILLTAEHVEAASATNVGTPEFISLNRIAEIIFRDMNWAPPDGFRHLVDSPVGALNRALDGRRADKRCGWVPQTAVEDGIEKTIDWDINHHDPQAVKYQLAALLMSR